MDVTVSWATALSDEVVGNGFAVIENLLSISAVEQLRATSSRARGDGDIYICGREALERHPDLTLPLICSPLILDVCECLMGPFVQLDSFSLVGLRSHAVSGINWHRDVYGGVPRSREFERPMVLNLLIYLQDLTPATGPLRIIRGSHREPLVLTEEQRRQRHPREELFFLKAGDGIIIHNNLVHSRSPNQSDRDRLHISIVYSLSCMRQAINVSREPFDALHREVRRVGDIRLMRLLGEDTHAEARFNSGYLRADRELWTEWIKADRLSRRVI